MLFIYESWGAFMMDIICASHTLTVTFDSDEKVMAERERRSASDEVI